MSTAPLTGITVVDVSTMGPGPFASMVLADFGADVIEVVRPEAQELNAGDFFSRGKSRLVIDLRADGASDLVARLVDTADVFLEGYRPGTMERRGLGPDELLARNPALIYTRLTGWGQSGPQAPYAGHDINYIAMSGALGAIGEDVPAVPLNMVGDVAGGSMMAVLGTMLALYSRTFTAAGQVVDAAMVDGAAYVASPQFVELAAGTWPGRGHHMLSGLAPYYGVYACADGKYISVGAIETKFYRLLIKGIGLPEDLVASQHVRADWPRARGLIAEAFATRSRDDWAETFADSDACVYPVLDLGEVADDVHVAARKTVSAAHVAAPAPRLSATPGSVATRRAATADAARRVLHERGIDDRLIESFRASGALHLPG
ncbi:alpha-methylacyl-CoA racemase [Mycobacterium tuberculosis]|nr:alpha-methylacyl-CoA racemase [Mycobacterium tuberculosis]